jgi:hypothetical protein
MNPLDLLNDNWQKTKLRYKPYCQIVKKQKKRKSQADKIYKI